MKYFEISAEVRLKQKRLWWESNPQWIMCIIGGKVQSPRHAPCMVATDLQPGPQSSLDFIVGDQLQAEWKREHPLEYPPI